MHAGGFLITGPLGKSKAPSFNTIIWASGFQNLISRDNNIQTIATGKNSPREQISGCLGLGARVGDCLQRGKRKFWN